MFASLHCDSCHAGANLTDLKFHNIGLYDEDGNGSYPARDRGLIEITRKSSDGGAVRTPSLRNVALTGPYMHDGSIKTLTDAIRRHLDGSSPLRHAKLGGAQANDTDIVGLVAFLQSLSDQNFVTNANFSLPKVACGKPSY